MYKYIYFVCNIAILILVAGCGSSAETVEESAPSSELQVELEPAQEEEKKPTLVSRIGEKHLIEFTPDYLVGTTGGMCLSLHGVVSLSDESVSGQISVDILAYDLEGRSLIIDAKVDGVGEIIRSDNLGWETFSDSSLVSEPANEYDSAPSGDVMSGNLLTGGEWVGSLQGGCSGRWQLNPSVETLPSVGSYQLTFVSAVNNADVDNCTLFYGAAEVYLGADGELLTDISVAWPNGERVVLEGVQNLSFSGAQGRVISEELVEEELVTEEPSDEFFTDKGPTRDNSFALKGSLKLGGEWVRGADCFGAWAASEL